MGYNPNYRGSTAKASSRQTITGYQNGLMITLVKATPVAINTSSQLIKIDPSIESTVEKMVGVVVNDIPTSASGEVVDNGRLEDSGVSFAIGDVLYVSKAGALTNTKPSIGVGGFVSGDFVILVGVVVKNEFDVLKKDIKIMLSLVGQL